MPEEYTHFGFENVSFKEKKEKVNSVFHSVAKKYDLMNDMMSFGIHRLWKRIAVSHCDIRPHQFILDIAGGTGDMCQLFASALQQTGHVYLLDINGSMLVEGRKKLLDAGFFKGISYIQSNAEQLPFASYQFDRISIAFGLRNVPQKQHALNEMYRTLKPGGKVMILEFSHPETPWFQQLYDAYSFNMIPILGKLLTGDKKSYQYLVESIRMHPDQATLLGMMQQAGFEQCRYENLTNGIVAIHTGYKF